MIIDTRHLLAISEANSRGLSRLVSDAESGHDSVILRNNKPVAAVVGLAKLERLQELERRVDEGRLLGTVLGRVVTDAGVRHSIPDVLEHFGLTEADLPAEPAMELHNDPYPAETVVAEGD